MIFEPIIRIVILAALVRLLLSTEKPFFCAALYAGVALVFRFAFGWSPLAAIIATAITFGLTSLYFWLLHRLYGGALFWVILVAGIVIGLV